MLRAKLALWIMGAANRRAVDGMMDCVCGTIKNYDLQRGAPILDVLVRRWLDSSEPR